MRRQKRRSKEFHFTVMLIYEPSELQDQNDSFSRPQSKANDKNDGDNEKRKIDYIYHNASYISVIQAALHALTQCGIISILETNENAAAMSIAGKRWNIGFIL